MTIYLFLLLFVTCFAQPNDSTTRRTLKNAIVVHKHARYFDGRGEYWYPPYSTRFSPNQWQLQRQLSTTRQTPPFYRQQQQMPPQLLSPSQQQQLLYQQLQRLILQPILQQQQQQAPQWMVPPQNEPRFTPVPTWRQQVDNFLDDFIERFDGDNNRQYRPRVTVSPLEHGWTFSTRFPPFNPSIFGRQQGGKRPSTSALLQQFLQGWKQARPWGPNRPIPGWNYAKMNNIWSKKAESGFLNATFDNATFESNTTTVPSKVAIEEINIDSLFTTPAMVRNESSGVIRVAVAEPVRIPVGFDDNDVTFRTLATPGKQTTVITPMPTAWTWTWMNRTLAPTTLAPATTPPGPVLNIRPTFSTQILSTFLTPGLPKTTSAPFIKFECGKNIYMMDNATYMEQQQARIIGGIEARINEFPWQVRITYRNGFLCGGAVVTSRHILTAAHCIITNTPSYYHVYLGDHHRNVVDNGEQMMTIQKIVVHPDYVESTNQHDLAIIETASEILFDRTAIRPVCLPAAEAMPTGLDAFVGKTAVVTGWGRLREGGGISPTLQKANIPILPQSDCIKSYRTSKFSDDMMCAGNNGNVDTCQGDSGGPLIIQSSGRYFIQGVTSWGYGCARPNYPGVVIEKG